MFVHFGIKDALDILLVGLLLYNIYKMMKDSGTINIFAGVMAFIGVWVVVTRILDMRLLGAIMDKLVSVGVLILVILFQDEIRRFLVDWDLINDGGSFSDYSSPIKKKIQISNLISCL